MKKSVKYKNVNYRNIDNNSALHKKKRLIKNVYNYDQFLSKRYTNSHVE